MTRYRKRNLKKNTTRKEGRNKSEENVSNKTRNESKYSAYERGFADEDGRKEASMLLIGDD